MSNFWRRRALSGLDAPDRTVGGGRDEQCPRRGTDKKGTWHSVKLRAYRVVAEHDPLTTMRSTILPCQAAARGRRKGAHACGSWISDWSL